MNRLENVPVPKERKPSFFGFQPFLAWAFLALASEVIAKIPKGAKLSQPFLAEGSVPPVFDENENTLTVATGTTVAIQINGKNYLIKDTRDRIKGFFAILQIGGRFINKVPLKMLGGRFKTLPQAGVSSVIVDGIEFSHSPK